MVDAGMSICMPSGICMEMRSARPRASTIGCRVVDNMTVQAQLDHGIVAQLPDPTLGIPPPTGLVHPVADGHAGKGDADHDDLVVGEWTPRRFAITLRDGSSRRDGMAQTEGPTGVDLKLREK